MVEIIEQVLITVAEEIKDAKAAASDAGRYIKQIHNTHIFEFRSFISFTHAGDAWHGAASAVRAPREYKFAWWKCQRGPTAVGRHAGRLRG